MKSNETNQAFIIHCKCNFTHMLISTYNMVLSCHFQREYCKNLSYPIIIQGNLKEKTSKFFIKRPDLNLYVFFEISDKIITDYYAYFKYHIYKTIPETHEYDYILEIRYVNEDQCDFFICFSYDHRIYLSEKDLLEEIKFRKNIYKTIEKSLRNFEILKISAVYTTINSRLDIIFDVLKNMKVINKYCRLLAHEINYEGKLLKKDIIIHLKEYRGKSKFESEAKVNKCSIIKTDIGKKGIITLLFRNDSKYISYYSKTKIKIIIYEYNGCCSIYILYFFFNVQKNKQNFINFTKTKKKELVKFKKIVENYNQTFL